MCGLRGEVEDNHLWLIVAYKVETMLVSRLIQHVVSIDELQVVLNFTKKDSRINAGMFAKVKLYTTKYEGELVVPSDSIVKNDDDSAYLFVVNDNGTVSRREVKTGKSVDSLIQVTDNLMEGERVVYEGMLSLSEGAKVNDLNNPKGEK